MKRNLVHRSSVSGADSGSAVFQARCLSRNTSIFTWISSEISSSFSGWELVEGARGQGVAVAWGWGRCTAGQSRPRGWPREATAQAENNGARAEPWAPQAFLHPQASSPGPLQVSVTALAPRCPSAHQLHDPPRLKPPTMSTCLYNLTAQGHTHIEGPHRAPTEMGCAHLWMQLYSGPACRCQTASGGSEQPGRPAGKMAGGVLGQCAVAGN